MLVEYRLVQRNGCAGSKRAVLDLGTASAATTIHLSISCCHFTSLLFHFLQVYVWSSEFDLEVGGMDASFVWEVEYESEAEVCMSFGAVVVAAVMFAVDVVVFL